MKQLVSFYQIVTRTSQVYQVPMPESVQSVLRIFEIFSLNIGAIGIPLQCLSLDRFSQQLMFMCFAPIIVAAALVALFVLYSCCQNGCRSSMLDIVRTGLLNALPWLLLLFYLVFPMVSSLAFGAFDCEEFDDGRSYLRVDYRVDCSSDEYDEVRQLCWIAICCYPLAVPLAYVLLLAHAHPAIINHQPSDLSRALAFLHRDFEPGYMYWQVRPCHIPRACQQQEPT